MSARRWFSDEEMKAHYNSEYFLDLVSLGTIRCGGICEHVDFNSKQDKFLSEEWKQDCLKEGNEIDIFEMSYELGKRCVNLVCGSPHHFQYITFGHESLGELIFLCDYHHKIYDEVRKFKNKLSWIESLITKGFFTFINKKYNNIYIKLDNYPISLLWEDYINFMYKKGTLPRLIHYYGFPFCESLIINVVRRSSQYQINKLQNDEFNNINVQVVKRLKDLLKFSERSSKRFDDRESIAGLLTQVNTNSRQAYFRGI